jgi:DNA invertase Pin-like site-specific DNA recombinase
MYDVRSWQVKGVSKDCSIQGETVPNNRCAIYARCSTGEQNPDMQVSELLEYAERRGFQVVAVHVDIASGSVDSRPELNKALALAKQRKIDFLVCWKVDRLGRSLRHLVNTIAELESVGVCFVSLKDNLDFSTPAGRLMFNVIGAMAQFERDLIRERTLSGMAAARRRGARIGRPPVNIDAEHVRGLRSQGLSWDKIAVQTGFSRETCRRAAA